MVVRTFLLEEKSNLKLTIERNYGGDKYDFQGRLDTVCLLLKYIERVHSYFMGIVFVMMRVIITAIGVALAGCGADTPTTDSTEEMQEMQEVVDNTNSNLGEGEKKIPEVFLISPKPDPLEADKPLEALIVDIDAIITESIADIEKAIGEPVAVEFEKDKPVETRYYELKDGSAMRIITRNLEPFMVGIAYRRGYPTSIEALKAAGFEEQQLTFKRHIPRVIINKGVIQSAQDEYSAKTENKEYRHIGVFQNEHGTWDSITFGMD